MQKKKSSHQKSKFLNKEFVTFDTLCTCTSLLCGSTGTAFSLGECVELDVDWASESSWDLDLELYLRVALWFLLVLCFLYLGGEVFSVRFACRHNSLKEHSDPL